MIVEKGTASRRAELTDAEQEKLSRRLRGLKQTAKPQAISRVERNGNVPLSFAQQRLWFLDQLNPGSSFYNFPIAIRLKGVLNKQALQKALEFILRRHESLRTRFVWGEGNPVQVVSDDAEFEMREVNVGKKADKEAELKRLIDDEIHQPFNLSKDSPLRAVLFRIGVEDHALLVTMHHICSDAWSLSIFFKELTELYGAYLSGQTPSLRELPIRYTDFAIWQRQWLQGEVLEKQLDYWKKKLTGAQELLDLPMDRPRPAKQSFEGAERSIVLPSRLSEALKQLCHREGSTMFMVLLAVFKVLLSRYSRQEDILVGGPIAGRNRIETEGMIGFFVNTLVFRTDLSGDPTFREVLARVRDVALGAYANQDLPFERLVEELQPERDSSRTPLINVMFVFQNAPAKNVEFVGLEMAWEKFESRTAKFDLTLAFEEQGEKLLAAFEYNTSIFDDETISRMLLHLQTLLEGVVANPEERISKLPILTEGERRQIVIDWNPM